MIWTIILNNWRGIGLVLIPLVLFFGGWYTGDKNARMQCAIEVHKTQQARQSEKDRLQRLADKKSKEYEEARQRAHAALDIATKRLADEYKNNPDYTNCHAGPGFLQLYADAIRPNPTSNPTR